MSMKSRGNGKAKKTVSKVLSDPMDKMSVGRASSKSAIPGFKKGGSVTRADGCISKGHTKGRSI
jgi:hypothetical protein